MDYKEDAFLPEENEDKNVKELVEKVPENSEITFGRKNTDTITPSIDHKSEGRIVLARLLGIYKTLNEAKRDLKQRGIKAVPLQHWNFENNGSQLMMDLYPSELNLIRLIIQKQGEQSQ